MKLRVVELDVGGGLNNFVDLIGVRR